jgi:hypothetical protein
MLVVQENSSVIIKQRHALLSRISRIDERRIVMCKIGQHKMLNVALTMGRHDTTVDLEKDVVVFSSGLAAYIQGFPQAEQSAETET